jgi:pSer/pThr/pTyr-binding forkhead associated (FHA) protein
VGAGSLLLPNNDRYVLAEHSVAIGRSPDCDITIVDSNVSRRHAEIQPRGDGFVVVDLESTNGTRVNGVRVTERELQDGDELAFGNTRMIFQAS